ncbi:MAG: hypothetical protein ACFFA3_03940 [Promethearchaeota archaeon]
MEWEDIIDNLYLWYNEFIEWYSVQPIYGQILSIIGIIALLALLVTLIYYVIKGIAYLVYYILKGIYLLLKYIGLGIFKLCEGFYKLVSGEMKIDNTNDSNLIQPAMTQTNVLFCNECGRKFSEKMIRKIRLHGNVFCVHCGKEFTLKEYQISLAY